MIPCNHNYELSQELKAMDEAQARADTREAMIETAAMDLMQKGYECYPFSLKNIFEALSNLQHADEIILATYIGAAGTHSSDTVLFELLGVRVVRTIKQYWLQQAKAVAEKEYS